MNCNPSHRHAFQETLRRFMQWTGLKLSDTCNTMVLCSGMTIQHHPSTVNTLRTDQPSFLRTTRPPNASQHPTKQKVGVSDTGEKESNGKFI